MRLLARKIVEILTKKKFTISFAESCTGGMISSAITSIKGSSKIFSIGMVVYSNKSKINVLKIPKNIVNKYGAVSSEVCIAMIKNISKISKTNISLSVTGIAGPGGGTKKKPVGLVYIGIKKDDKKKVKKYLFKNKGRHNIQKAAVRKSLDLILNTFM